VQKKEINISFRFYTHQRCYNKINYTTVLHNMQAKKSEQWGTCLKRSK